jgi:hypothetical protein
MANFDDKVKGILRSLGGTVLTSLNLLRIVFNKRIENMARRLIFGRKIAAEYDERRNVKRLNLEKDILFRHAQGKPAFGHILNISSSGMYLLTDVPLYDREEIHVNLLGKALGSLAGIDGHIVRRGDNGVAVKFD